VKVLHRATLAPWVKVGFGVVQALLVARVALLLVAPAPSEAYVAFLGVTEWLVEPFRDAVRSVLVDATGGPSILDTKALAALVGYTLIEVILLRVLFRRRAATEPMPPLPITPEDLRGPTR
jgi:hypothetical protein